MGAVSHLAECSGVCEPQHPWVVIPSSGAVQHLVMVSGASSGWEVRGNQTISGPV